MSYQNQLGILYHSLNLIEDEYYFIQDLLNLNSKKIPFNNFIQICNQHSYKSLYLLPSQYYIPLCYSINKYKKYIQSELKKNIS